LQDYDEAIKLAPNNADLYRFRCRTYLKTGEYEKAVVDCTRCLELKPDSAAAHSYKGDAYLALGKYELAIKEYDISIALSPEQKDLNSYFGRAEAKRRLGLALDAAADYENAVIHAPDNPDYVKQLKDLGGDAAVKAAQAKTPAALPKGGGRVLAPFTGYAIAETCAEVKARIPGTPWDDDTAKDGTVGSDKLGQYDSLLRHTMQGLRLLYGTMTPAEEKSFDSFWAPFFDQPTPAALEYFQKITPLLDELAATLMRLDGVVAQAGEALQATMIAQGISKSGATHVAVPTFQNLKDERAKLRDLLKKIDDLGNPPNPLAAKCAARERHKKAVGSQGEDIMEFLKNSEVCVAGVFLGAKSFGGSVSKSHPKYSSEWTWEGNTFRFASQHNDPNGFNYAAPNCGVYNSGGRTEVEGTFSADGKVLEKAVYRLFSKECDRNTKAIIGPILKDHFEVANVPLAAVDMATDWKKVIYELKGAAVVSHVISTSGGTRYDQSHGDSIKLTFTIGQQVFSQEVVNAISNALKGLSAQGGSTTPTALPPAQQTGPGKGTTADPENDPQVKAEAIAHHTALAEQIRKDAARWADDARKEPNPDRRKELEKRAGELYANAQAEQDIADSIRTGVLVHTRTEWDKQQHEALVNSIKEELTAFDAQTKLLENTPKVADMITGAEGVDLREKAWQRISEAIKSPDGLQKLKDLYAQLQDKVVSQGEQKMAAAKAEVETWEQRVTIAENVQWAASMGVMLGTLWAPIEVGTLAIGYAGATGFAEDGVRGATIAVGRSVSSKADVMIAAYEGATTIDPNTGKPGGAWGAVESALWAIGTNKAMDIAGARIQKAKADYALAKQAAGGPGVKPVAKAGPDGGRIKEYDFKTPEERYKMELEAAKTPEEIAAVKKKNAIQVEREAMAKEGEAALQKAEDAVRRGEDPAKAKKQYEDDLKAIHEKYAAKETRNNEHQEVLDQLRFNKTDDIKSTGSDPKTAASDMDFTPQGKTPHEAYQKGKKYTDALAQRGHNIVEYGDRWVDTTMDATIWKPGFGTDKPGSSSFEAEVIFGTLPHSDKFGTKGGIEWTSSPIHSTVDPLGAVLANAGKAVGAGLGNSRSPDLHTIGKSAVKAAEAAGISVDPQLKAKIDALKAHQTPEQAGVVELGADPATKQKQIKDFLSQVENLMGQAYKAAKAQSDQNMKGLEQQAKAAGKSDEAYQLLAQIKAYQAGNQAALTTIAQASPGLAAQMDPPIKVSSIVPEPAKGAGSLVSPGGLSRALFDSRESAMKAPALPANGNDPAFAGLGKRCKEGASRLDEKLKKAKPGSQEARYLGELKKALEQGEKNPAEAVRSVRGISGTELAAVLAQLGVPADTGKK